MVLVTDHRRVIVRTSANSMLSLKDIFGEEVDVKSRPCPLIVDGAALAAMPIASIRALKWSPADGKYIPVRVEYAPVFQDLEGKERWDTACIINDPNEYRKIAQRPAMASVSVPGGPVFDIRLGGVSRKRSARGKKSKSRSKSRSKLPPYLARNLQSLQFSNPRGRATRGWKILSPKRGTARHALKAKCGSRAFLLPDKEGFPVMSMHSRGCQYSCPGLHAAYSRAQQWGHHAVAAKAHALLAKHC